ncbi:phosphatases II, partial [Acaromyces ingoldii]
GLSWRYEMRRQCQEILPEALYLGPADSGRYLPPLHALGITAIVIVRTDVEAPFLKPRFPNQFQYAVFDVGDRFEQNLIRIVPELVSFIDGATRDGGKVLVHDDNGISRAPALVIMYLMEKFSVSYDVAAAHVQERRYCVHLNEGFVVQCK